MNFLLKYFNNETKTTSFNLKNKLFKHGYKAQKCERCNIETWQDVPAPLELHHIDGNNKNNTLSNLQILCPNCHSLTDNFRSANRKSNTHVTPINI